jgi:dipeptide/tripeptide permease
MSSRDARAVATGAVVALLAGIVVLAVASGTIAIVAGAALLGLAAIGLVSLVFLLVGESEERDRRRHPRG